MIIIVYLVVKVLGGGELYEHLMNTKILILILNMIFM